MEADIMRELGMSIKQILQTDVTMPIYMIIYTWSIPAGATMAFFLWMMRQMRGKA